MICASFKQMSCKKSLMLCLLVSGTLLLLYLTYGTKMWTNNAMMKELQKYPYAKRPNGTSTEESDMYHVAYPRKYEFIIDQTDICEQRKPYLVVIVPLTPGNLDARNGIRKTWGEQKVFGDKTVLVLFLMGLHSGNDEDALQAQLRNESQQYKDLLQSNFMDSYRNLTIKTMVMMEWLNRNCQKASYAMKVDADVLVNTKNLMDMLVGLNPVQSNYMTGVVWYGNIVIRDPSNKFYLPYEVYSKPTYPPYPLGMCYIISLDLPQKFIQEAKKIKPIYIEDAYLGICLESLGITPTKPPNIGQFEVKLLQYDRCFYSKLIAILTESTNKMTSYWTDIHSSSQPC